MFSATQGTKENKGETLEDLFNYPFFCRDPNGSRFTELPGIDAVFQRCDQHTILILEAWMEEIVEGLCFMFGKQPDTYVIPDGRMVLFRETSRHDTFIYPYHPGEYGLIPETYIERCTTHHNM